MKTQTKVQASIYSFWVNLYSAIVLFNSCPEKANSHSSYKCGHVNPAIYGSPNDNNTQNKIRSYCMQVFY